ncbi:MAG TPA: trehalose-phosphatase, partial [Bacteroidales bacterium]|nr:trehalose-phosphatase [Bacteroidales bacterium]
MLQKIRESYQQSKARVIFLDYDGTLVTFTKVPSEATIDARTLNVIDLLSRISENRVIIISGRSNDFLEKQFQSLKVDLIAEHGFMIREHGQVWIKTHHAEMSWRNDVWQLFERIKDHIPGTFIEEKEASLALHYRDADPLLSAMEISNFLAPIHLYKVDHPELEVMEGHKIVEIKMAGYNKGTAAVDFLKTINYDFILALGDDVTDENLFRELPENAFTIKVGQGNSIAVYRLQFQQDVLPFL